MASQAYYKGCVPITIRTGATALAKGIRVVAGSDGFSVPAALTVRGDYMTREAIEANSVGAGFDLNLGTMPFLASEAVTVGAIVYGAALGKSGVTSAGGAAVIGRCEQAASGDGVIGILKALPVA